MNPELLKNTINQLIDLKGQNQPNIFAQLRDLMLQQKAENKSLKQLLKLDQPQESTDKSSEEIK